MAIPNTSAPWYVRGTSHELVTYFGRVFRRCIFILPSMGPPHRSDVLGLREERYRMEKPSICPVCPRRCRRYHTSS